MESLDFVFLVRSEPLWPNAIHPVRTRSVHGPPGSAGVGSFLTEGDGAQAVPASDVLFVLGTVAYLWGLNRSARTSSRARQREACRRLSRNPHAAGFASALPWQVPLREQRGGDGVAAAAVQSPPPSPLLFSLPCPLL